MNYLVAVLRDRIEAESAYSDLERKGIPLSQMSILGRGYKSADEFGLLDPYDSAWKQIRLMATWLIPFGFGAGVIFSIISGLQTFAWAGEWGNHAVGGVLGAIAASMGSIFVGGGAGIILSGDVVPYRNRINAGKYLLVVQGTAQLVRESTTVLRKYTPETLQGYEERG
ncbi:hypothetical protein [Prochlorothrix hollandica]|uniref:Uncharacterized protein n=1 Tax=Prochlorothrix hollandica PCC 9006 = CALU 1027 TaxID=317619 RepID=A0A0M2PP16_PROHO|nr:hypothetical protein [Prochlorothrix hollandica]KKI98330.1 hypothetical protein PROH_19370 [Prochlorothrix hollandica PCC 9006 = CALU 1027]